MASTRSVVTGSCLILALLLLGGPAMAEDELPPPPAAPVEAAPAADAPTADAPPPPPPVTVDEDPPALQGPAAIPPPPAAGQGGSMQYRLVRNACCDRRDECGWRIDAGGCRYGRWDLTLEGLYTVADQPQGVLGVPVARVAPGPLLPNQFNWNGVDYDDAFGGRVGLTYAVAPFSRVELRATWYGNFTGSQRQTGAFGFLPGPGGVGGISALNTATLEMEADLYSGELNYWEEVNCSGKSRFDLGGGLRVIRFEETAAVTNWASPVVVGGGAPSLSSKARSDFIGLQFGGVWHYDFSPRFEFRAIGKVLAGNVNQTVTVNDANILGGGAHQSSTESDDIRLGADVDLGLLWRLHRRIGITFGYNLLILDGVARANETLDFTASTSGAVQARLHEGQIVSHSLFLGLNLNF